MSKYLYLYRGPATPMEGEVMVHLPPSWSARLRQRLRPPDSYRR